MSRFVRFYPSDWRSGCIGMTCEQEGLYIRICTFYYETERRVPLDDSTAAKMLGMHTNAYRKTRNQLADLGKIKLQDDGWSVARAEKELAAATYSQRRENGQVDQDTERDTLPDTIKVTPIDTLGVTPIDTRGVFSENVNEINAPLKSHSKERKNTPLPPKGGPTPSDALQAFEGYNATALKCGLQQAAKLTPDRQRKIIARLRDYGLDGWNQALANIERSSFLTGSNDKGWRANLDFLLQASSFAKTHDGTYGNGRHAKPTGKREIWEMPARNTETEEQMRARVNRDLGIPC